MAHVSDERVFGRVYGLAAALTLVELIQAHWPHVNPRTMVLAHAGGPVALKDRRLVAVLADVRKLAPGEPMSELARFVQGAVAAMVATGATVEAPEIPF